MRHCTWHVARGTAKGRATRDIAQGPGIEVPGTAAWKPGLRNVHWRDSQCSVQWPWTIEGRGVQAAIVHDVSALARKNAARA